MNFWRKLVLFLSEPSEVSKNSRLRFIAIKTNDGLIKGKISFYCKMLGVSLEGFRKYLKSMDKPWKYEALAEEMLKMSLSSKVCKLF